MNNKTFTLALTVYLCIVGQAIWSQEPPLCATVSGMSKELQVFPVHFDGVHIMNVYFKYVGTKPEDAESRGAKGLPEKWRNGRVDYYRYEMENLTNSIMRIYEIVLRGKNYYADAEGKLHESPPQTVNRDKIVETWGANDSDILPNERQIMKDFWIRCAPEEESYTSTTTFCVEIVDSGHRFAFDIVRVGFPK